MLKSYIKDHFCFIFSFNDVIQTCWLQQPEKRPSAEKVCNILKRLTDGGKNQPAKNAAAGIELDIYENANPTFENDDFYENNCPGEQPMYLDMCA